MKKIMDKIHHCIDSTIEKNNAYIARTFYLGRGVEYFVEKNEKQIEIKRKILKSVVEDT